MTRIQINARIFTGTTLLEDHALVIHEGRIEAVLPTTSAAGSVEQVLELPNQTLIPGLIDLQVNGGAGVMFNQAPSSATIAAIGRAHRPFGTTGYLPTLITDRPDTTAQALNAVNTALQQGMPGVLGVHLEGPYLNPERCGVHDPGRMQLLKLDNLPQLQLECGGTTLLTVAPECLEAGVINQLTEQGVIVCAGHTNATFDHTCAALSEGLSGFTHLFNAMSQLGSREPGTVGAALADPNSFCGIINDGIHVHPQTLRLALSCKPQGKLFLVTDAMACVGSADDSFQLYGQTLYNREGRCQLDDGTLAGSSLNMITAVRNCSRWLDLDWQEAVRMASTYPANLLGLGSELGMLAPGYRANVVAVDSDFRVCHSWIDGDLESYSDPQ